MGFKSLFKALRVTSQPQLFAASENADPSCDTSGNIWIRDPSIPWPNRLNSSQQYQNHQIVLGAEIMLVSNAVHKIVAITEDTNGNWATDSIYLLLGKLTLTDPSNVPFFCAPIPAPPGVLDVAFPLRYADQDVNNIAIFVALSSTPYVYTPTTRRAFVMLQTSLNGITIL